MTSPKELEELARSLVRIPSRNPPGEEKEVAEFIYEWLTRQGVEAYMVGSPFPQRPQVVAVVRGAAEGPVIALNGHMDVVPEGDPADWTKPPFEGVVEEGKLYGRGACDMKGALAVMMLLARDLKGSLERGTLVLTFAIGEERGEPGTRHILLEELPRLGLKPDFGIVMEPTNLDVVVAHNGLVWVKIIVRGRSAHSSTPEKGVNAISSAARIINEIDRYNAEVVSRVTHRLTGRPSLKATMIRGGVKENIIPDRCEIVLDYRVIPGKTIDEAVSEVKELAEKAKLEGTTLEYEVIQYFEPAETDPSNPLITRLLEAAREVTGREVRVTGAPYGTDMRNFVNDAGIPAVVFGPGDVRQAHRPDEYVEIDQLVKSYNIIRRFLATLP